MARTKQNQVPYEFDALYDPILKLKKLLMMRSQQIDGSDLIQGLVMVHYTTFIMLCLYHQKSVDTSKIIETRTLIEQILNEDSFRLYPEQKSRIMSFIDNLGKELNITLKPYVYIAMYSGHLDAEIYRKFHSTKGVYNFINYDYVHPETLAKMRECHMESIKVLEQNNLPANHVARHIKL